MSAPMNIFLHDLLRCNSSNSIDLVSDNARILSPVLPPSSPVVHKIFPYYDDDNDQSSYSDGNASFNLKASTSEPDLCSINHECGAPFQRERRNSDPSDSRRCNSGANPRKEMNIPTKPSPMAMRRLFCPGAENSVAGRNRLLRLASSLPNEIPN